MPIPKKNTAPQPKTARERVYTQLREWIINGTMKPGEKIMDQELAEYFSVSRTPVREAMQMLAEQKLINITPGKESTVAPIDPEATRQAYNIIADLYALALTFAFPKLTKQDVMNLRELNRRFSESWTSHDITGAHTIDKEFHTYFLKIAPNDFLPGFIDVLDGHIARIEQLYFSQERFLKDSVAQHEAIIQAIDEGDLQKAVEGIKYNWLYTYSSTSTIEGK